ncbi:MAG TPA: aminopeptidase N, partial [Caulobacteraceae bacterium]|nr:aminopeptidase N [Caulobacteraceae bacterium]
MRTEPPPPVRLADYRPPGFLVDDVELDIVLEPHATRVKARLAIRRDGQHAEPLRLNGERLKPVSVTVDGRTLASGDYAVDEEWLTIPNTPDAFRLETEV